MSFSIAGKTAIVTGAANGVGLAIARHFAEKGANVMCADMDEAGLIAALGEEGEDSQLRYFAGDLREKLTIANLLSATIDAFEGVDILVNASRQVERSEPLDADSDAVENLLQQNVINGLRLSQAVAKRMIAQAEESGTDINGTGQIGSIINLSSIAARRTHPALLAFSVSSAATEQMTRSLAVALAPNRIRVNALAFGSVMSCSLQDALNEHDGYREEIINATPLGRIASAGELADAAQFLASEGSSFMTGQVMTLDGGRSLVDRVGAPAH
ncbi:MAG: 7-alpha-hydroxysteroid dehydrogenase [Halocynthiibacter sp.]|jgi:7-alpha-hydroxysteroid dehydrogenase